MLHLRNDVYLKAQYLPMKFYDKTSTGSVINRISGDTATLQAFILRITQEVIVQFFMLVGIIIIMFALEWRLTLLSLLPVPAVVHRRKNLRAEDRAVLQAHLAALGGGDKRADRLDSLHPRHQILCG